MPPLSSFLPAASDADLQPSQPRGARGGAFQGAKVFSEATKDVSKCFLQVDMDFLSQLSGPLGLLSSSS